MAAAKLFSRALNKLWLLFATVIISLAVLLSLLRAFLPFIDMFRPDIELFLSQKTGATISIDKLSAEWASHGPKLVVSGVSIAQKDWLKVDVERMSVAVNLWQTLYSLSISTDEIVIENSYFKSDVSDLLTRDMRLSQASEYSSFDFLVETLLGQNDVTLSDIQVDLSRKGFRYSTLTIDHLQIDAFDDIHQVTGELKQDDGGALSLVAELYGDPRFPESKLEVYIESQKVDLSRLPLFEATISGLVQQGNLSGRLWASWKYNQWQSLAMDLSLEPVVFAIDKKSFGYQSIQTQVVWNELGQQQRELFLRQFKAIDDTGSEIDLAGLRISLTNQTPKQVHLAYNNVKPGKLNNIWALLIEEPALQEWFLAANPQLTIDNFALTLQQQADDWDILSGRVELSEGYVSRTEVSPQMPVFSGVISVADNKVDFDFVSERGEIDFRPTFRWPIPTESVAIKGHFDTFADSRHLVFDNIEFKMDGVHVRAQGNLYFQQGFTPEISVQAELLEADVAKRSLYFPVEEMGVELVEYLDTNVTAGTIDYAKFNLQGRLVDNFMEQPDLTFEIQAHAKDLDYQYQPNFPKLDHLDADLYFTQNAMYVSARNAYYQAIEVKQATARIDDFSAANAKLDLAILARTDTNSARQYINTSPLKEIVGTVLEDIQPQKPFDVALNLAVPLESNDGFSISGQVLLNKNPIVIRPLELDISSASGEVNFKDEEIWSPPIALKLFSGNSQVKLSTKDRDGALRIELDASGNVDAEQVATWLSQGRELPVKGTTNYQAQGWICIQNCLSGLAAVDVQSELDGVTIDLVEPLKKAPQEKRKVAVSVRQLSESQHIEFSAGEQLFGALNYQRFRDALRLVQGNISLGSSQRAVGLVNNTLAVNIQLDAIKLNELLLDVERLTGSLDKPESDNDFIPVAVNYSINALDAFGVMLSDIQGKMVISESMPYRLTFSSAQGTGEIQLNADRSIDIVMNQLTLTEQDIKTEELSSDGTVSEADIERLPTLRFRCLDCNIKQLALGQLDATITKQAQKVSIDGNLVRPDLVTINYALVWDLTNQTTLANIDLNSARIGRLLRDWGVAVGIRDSAATSQLTLSWQGGPHQFALKTLSGDATLNVREGYLEEVSDAKARIFSLFSMQSVVRRLSLDFKDIYKQGFFYDSIKSRFTIKNGLLTTNELTIDGAAANVSITGDVNLVGKTVDQIAVVSPKVTSSLPVLAGWAVEPTTGVLVWLLSKIFEPAIDVISRIEYRMVGSWDNPQVIELSKSTKEIELTEEQLEAIRQVQSETETSTNDRDTSKQPSEPEDKPEDKPEAKPEEKPEVKSA
ncbi:MAG: TIGR02099 family protein [Gammaproteobacteria bacterium]|nr:TIGR02099 family protein [Gammaproteobacteria bacterium]